MEEMDEMDETDIPRECECEVRETCGVLGRVRGVPAALLLPESSPLVVSASCVSPEGRKLELLVPRSSLGRSPLGPRPRCDSCGFLGLRGT